jgi:hypothetical protein
MLFNFGTPRLSKFGFRFLGLCWLGGLMWVLLFPQEETYHVPLPASTEPQGNFWIKAQKQQPRPAQIPSGNYYFDDPPEEWHAADNNDDSDDPELYIDKYDDR